MNICFYDSYTEAHRELGSADELLKELSDLGIYCTNKPEVGCKAIFCGSFFKFREVKLLRRTYPTLPIIHYNWDLYEFQLGEPLWQEYLKELLDPSCIDIWTPSNCVVNRTREHIDKDAIVIKAPVKLFEEEVWDGGYVLNAMRKYPDPNRDLVKEVCSKLNLPLIETQNSFNRKDYTKAVAGARFLVSAQWEASTGGLSLLEGYALGKPVLLSDSPYHGGVDYFGGLAHYFNWESIDSCLIKVKTLYYSPIKLKAENCKAWVEENYSQKVFAQNMAKRLSELL